MIHTVVLRVYKLSEFDELGVTAIVNNHKAIGFMLSQFKGMILTFGQSEETLVMFINQVE